MRTVIAILAALTLAPATAIAGTASANFQGNCTSNGGTVTCIFDAQRPSSDPSSCPDSFIWKYRWDFGDGSSTLVGSDQVTHEYDASTDYFPELLVICWDGALPSKTRHLCIHFGTLGCLQINAGWN